MKTLQKMNQILKEHKAELYDKYQIKEMGVFGSFVRGEQKKRSDVDILVEFEEVPDLFTFLEMERHLEKLLSKKVDLVEKTAVRHPLREIILKEVVYI